VSETAAVEEKPQKRRRKNANVLVAYEALKAQKAPLGAGQREVTYMGKKVLFTRYLRELLAKHVKQSDVPKKDRERMLEVLESMRGTRGKSPVTKEQLIAATAGNKRVALTVNPDGSVRVGNVGKWYEGKPGRKTVKVQYTAKTIVLTVG
jgi:hypothetical protein